MRFRDVPIGGLFFFSDPAGWSIGRKLRKVSPRCYETANGSETYHGTSKIVRHQVGTVGVSVMLATEEMTPLDSLPRRKAGSADPEFDRRRYVAARDPCIS